MAEATGLRQSLPYPVYGAPFGFVIPITEADGDLVTSAAGLDSEISKNGDTLTDCTNEATEIGGGLYYLLLTATEMTADVVSGVTKTSTADAKTTSWSLYPRKLVTVRSGTAAGGDTGYITLDASASAVDDYYNGLVCIATIDSTVEARIITDYTGSSKQAAVTPAWNTAPDSDDTFVLKLPEGVQLPTVDVTLWKGAAAAAMTGDAYARLGAPAGASVSADIAAIEAQTDDIGVAGAGLTALQQTPFVFIAEQLYPYGVEATILFIVPNLNGTGAVTGLIFDGVAAFAGLSTPTGLTQITNVTEMQGGYYATLTAEQMQIERGIFFAFQNPPGTSRGFYIQVTTYGAGGALSALPSAAAGAAGGLPTMTEFEARTLPAADYTVVGDLPAAAPSSADNATAAAAAILVTPANKLETDASGHVSISGTKNTLDSLNDIDVAAIIAGITDGTYDLQEMMRIIFAVLAGKSSGSGTSTVKFRDPADTKDRVTATVVDGNRTAVTLNAS